MRILLVHGHTAEARAAQATLSLGGVVVDHVRTAGDALAYLQTYEYDIAVLDGALPDLDGLAALRRFRAQGFDVPVLMLADIGSGRQRAEVLRAGADDLIAKPCDMEEMKARVEAVVRRRHGYAVSVLRVGPLEVDLSARAVRLAKQSISVTRKEYAILELLALRRGRVVAKQHFLEHLYNGIDGPETRVIDVFVCNLRKKFAALGYASMIDTVRGHGYILREMPVDGADIVALPETGRIAVTG